MKRLQFIIWMALLSVSTVNAQEINYKAVEKTRIIPKGVGQVFSLDFTPVTEFHFVQFGVYPIKTDWRKIKAPEQIGQVWLIRHNETIIKGVDEIGGYYIVKPYPNRTEADAAVSTFRSRKIRCWYNPDLTGANFTLVGFTEDLSK